MALLLEVLLPISIALLLVILFLIRINKLNTKHSIELGSKEVLFQQKTIEFEKKEAILTEKLNSTTKKLSEETTELEQLRIKYQEVSERNTHQNAENIFLKEKIEEQNKEFERLQKQATVEFENLANKILKKNTLDFSEANQKNMHDLITPLKEKIQTFEKKVEDTYEKGLKDQTDLKAELKKLHELNHKISTEANNLTRALKGDVKQQGNWGEIVLERILERSGLTEGVEFEREVVVQNAAGKIIRPDVIINLPDKKHIIIDSKVSLIAYERLVNEDDSTIREKHIKNHLLSLKTHIKTLNGKHYTSSPQFNTPDFVLLFIPIESSFSIAIEHDQNLFNYAWENKVVIVSPSTLLATLRTIASIWQQENQTRNAIEIAKQSGLLYGKFVGFITDIEKVGKNIDTLQKTYDEASKKLYTGSGNLVRRVEKLKELGISTSKEIPEKFTDK